MGAPDDEDDDEEEEDEDEDDDEDEDEEEDDDEEDAEGSTLTFIALNSLLCFFCCPTGNEKLNLTPPMPMMQPCVSLHVSFGLYSSLSTYMPFFPTHRNVHSSSGVQFSTA